MMGIKKSKTTIQRKKNNMKKPKFAAVIVAAGSGTRMPGETIKQFRDLNGIPVVAHSIKAFQENEYIDTITLVVPSEYTQYALNMCINMNFSKVHNIAEGGSQRFRSVYNGLKTLADDTDYVLIHDGARPLVSKELISRCSSCVQVTRACIAAVPAKDTMKKADAQGFVTATPDRAGLWNVQTPQAFSYHVIMEAYDRLFKTISEYGSDESKITDDAIIVENMTDCRVRIVSGEYRNIKITTEDDMVVARAFLSSNS